MNKVDILAFGAHPDDVEIGMGGTLYKYANLGYRTLICDLTYAELSSNGTVSERQEEAKQAATLLKTNRVQLDLPDRGLMLAKESIDKIVDVIRTYEPKLVFVPYPIDRHPDHGHCAALVKEAIFNAGIRKYETGQPLPAFRVTRCFSYLINGFHKPDFIIDISESMEQKLEALKAYKSQFIATATSVQTPLTNGYIETVTARERLFGKEVGVQYGEGFLADGPILVQDILGE
ncbi:bacillithiol biosynthesis deacetylase BshB1 [Alkalihalobacillus sp. LMS39]|uniref:bacillithiol biosynthesis deacetylase BshB1 n=1 Tax=Alkalihalobacillus sp. LMS39 TaxID=2924032 RepID=UPI001FB1CFD3|nr:bacillithiol biosynthesis deacetylase BshB1 [Alkalihalobacillus sp. LMS39]UOE92316.1 bacillithiol biosynthesis deacetylase BshB1 [Alkalihalobacillus sp. LMS39]